MTNVPAHIYNAAMTPSALQDLCETGQEQLMAMRYLEAEATLAEAEQHAWGTRDWDALSRLYMPLQEARRQRRQRCGEGVVCLDLLAQSPDDRIDARHVLENYPHGQLLVAGWGSIEPALAVRRMQKELGLYVESFLAAVYPISGSGETVSDSTPRAVAIVPADDVALPDPEPMTADELARRLPAHSIVLPATELPRGSRMGTTATYGEVMDMWERLHTPFLAAADAEPDLVRRMDGYRRTIRVDYASELAHQKLSDAARQMMRQAKASK